MNRRDRRVPPSRQPEPRLRPVYARCRRVVLRDQRACPSLLGRSLDSWDRAHTTHVQLDRRTPLAGSRMAGDFRDGRGGAVGRRRHGARSGPVTAATRTAPQLPDGEQKHWVQPTGVRSTENHPDCHNLTVNNEVKATAPVAHQRNLSRRRSLEGRLPEPCSRPTRRADSGRHRHGAAESSRVIGTGCASASWPHRIPGGPMTTGAWVASRTAARCRSGADAANLARPGTGSVYVVH